MNPYSLLTLPARLSMLPARIALHVWDAVGSRPSNLRSTDDLTDIEGEYGYWLYWVYPVQRVPTCPHTSNAFVRPA